MLLTGAQKVKKINIQNKQMESEQSNYFIRLIVRIQNFRNVTSQFHIYKRYTIEIIDCANQFFMLFFLCFPLLICFYFFF